MSLAPLGEVRFLPCTVTHSYTHTYTHPYCECWHREEEVGSCFSTPGSSFPRGEPALASHSWPWPLFIPHSSMLSLYWFLKMERRGTWPDNPSLLPPSPSWEQVPCRNNIPDMLAHPLRFLSTGMQALLLQMGALPWPRLLGMAGSWTNSEIQCQVDHLSKGISYIL